MFWPQGLCWWKEGREQSWMRVSYPVWEEVSLPSSSAAHDTCGKIVRVSVLAVKTSTEIGTKKKKKKKEKDQEAIS